MSLFARAGLGLAFGLAGLGRAALHAHACYTLGLWAGSRLMPPRKSNGANGAAPLKIAVLVVAHDESRVIVDCVRSLKEQRYPADHYFLIDDKLRILTAVKKVWNERVTTIFVRQGHYALDEQVISAYPPADLTIERIGDLLELSTAIQATS